MLNTSSIITFFLITTIITFSYMMGSIIKFSLHDWIYY